MDTGYCIKFVYLSIMYELRQVLVLKDQTADDKAACCEDKKFSPRLQNNDILVCVHNRRLNSAECFMIEGARGDDVWRRRAGVDSGVALISRHCVTATAAAAADQQEAEKSSFIDPPSHFPLSLSS